MDGGWWPRSADPAAELPGLILAVDQRHGPITQIMLGSASWDASQPARLRVDGPAGSRVVRLGWYETMPAGLLTATAPAGRTDLLTVPPHTSEPAARAAMDQAVKPVTAPTPRPAGRHHHSRHPGPPASIPTRTSPDNIQVSTWEWESGQDSARPRAVADPPGPDIHSSTHGGGADRSTHVIAVPASAPQ